MKTISTAGKLLRIDNSKPIVAIVGCGGKTTFLESLAGELGKNKKVLMTTTTKIMPPKSENIALCTNTDECENHKPIVGVQCFGIINESTGKLESLSPLVLEKITEAYDVVLIEADGSAGLPLKGWTRTEPVIPSYCTHTLGIVTLDGLGKTVDESTVFRTAEFLKLTGLHSGDSIDLRAIESMVFNKDGMFWNSVGEKSLWVNKVESPQQREIVVSWLIAMSQKRSDFFQITAYGSARKNAWERVV